MFKKIPIIILIVILIIFSIFVIPSLALNEFTSSSKFFMDYINNHVVLPMLESSNRYNPENDLLVAGYNNKSDFKSYCICVLVNGKQYDNYDYKIFLSTDNWKRINVVNQKTNETTQLPYYAFRYINGLWGTWGDLKYAYDTWTSSFDICKTNFDFYDASDGSLITSKSSFDNMPFIANTIEQLEYLSVGELAIGDNGVAPSLLNVSLIDVATKQTLFNICLKDYSEYVSRLDLDDPFSDLGYAIPWKILPEFNFIEGNQYSLVIEVEGLYTSTTSFICRKSISNVDIPLSNPEPTPDITVTPDPNQSILDSNKETQNKLDEQTNAIKENTETNKNIFQKIGEILSFINPFSENFFVYKLLELLFEGLKAFILPSSDFLSSFLSELSDWFSDRLGFLWTPFDFINDFLNRFLNDNLFNEPTIVVSDIYEPFTNKLFFKGFTFNFNTLCENETFNNLYNIYLFIVDFIIYVCLILFADKTLHSVLSGTPNSIQIKNANKGD